MLKNDLIIVLQTSMYIYIYIAVDVYIHGVLISFFLYTFNPKACGRHYIIV